MDVTLEHYSDDPDGIVIRASVPDAALDDGPLPARLEQALSVLRAREPGVAHIGDVAGTEGRRYFIAIDDLLPVPADYRPSLHDLLVGEPSVRREEVLALIGA
jgi:hypothetical protein